MADWDQLRQDLKDAKKRVRKGDLTDQDVEELDRRSDQVLARVTDFKTAMDAFQSSEGYARLDALTPPTRLDRIFVRIGRMPTWTSMGAASVLWLGFLLFNPNWPASLFLFAAWLLVFLAVPWLAERGHLVQFTVVSITAAAVVALCAVGAGLEGVTGSEYVAGYDFKPEANLPAGRYVHFGESDGQLLLEECATRQFIAVGASSVAHIDEASFRAIPDSPSLWDVVVHQRVPVIGYRTEC